MEPNQGHVIGHTLMPQIQSTQRANCQSIIGGKDGLHWRVKIQEDLYSLLADFLHNGTALLKSWVVLDTCFLHRYYFALCL
jgi:hypothetical protein